jgi:hypothetical protein
MEDIVKEIPPAATPAVSFEEYVNILKSTYNVKFLQEVNITQLKAMYDVYLDSKKDDAAVDEDYFNSHVAIRREICDTTEKALELLTGELPFIDTSEINLKLYGYQYPIIDAIASVPVVYEKKSVTFETKAAMIKYVLNNKNIPIISISSWHRGDKDKYVLSFYTVEHESFADRISTIKIPETGVEFLNKIQRKLTNG